MSRRNEEIVRAAVDAWNRGQWHEAMRDASDEIVIDNSTVEGEYRGIHRGRKQAMRLFERFSEPWNEVRLEITDLAPAGDLIFTRIRGCYRGRDGIEVEAVTGMCWTFEDGRLVHVFMPSDVDSARSAAGLPLE